MTAQGECDRPLRRLLGRLLGAALLLLLTFREIEFITDFGIHRSLGANPGVWGGIPDLTPIAEAAHVAAIASALALGLVLPVAWPERYLVVLSLSAATAVTVIGVMLLLPSGNSVTRAEYGISLIGTALVWCVSGLALYWDGRLPITWSERRWAPAAATVLVGLGCLVAWGVTLLLALTLAGWL